MADDDSACDWLAAAVHTWLCLMYAYILPVMYVTKEKRWT